MRKTIGRAILYFLTPTGCVLPTGAFAKRADIDNLERRVSSIDGSVTILAKANTNDFQHIFNEIHTIKRLISAPKPKAKAKARGRKNGKA